MLAVEHKVSTRDCNFHNGTNSENRKFPVLTCHCAASQNDICKPTPLPIVTLNAAPSAKRVLYHGKNLRGSDLNLIGSHCSDKE